ncbi:hypothetical protein R3W88_029873 [Solanum pinnatisectum]|uniref:Uncharacterized protein n=1 Tax=Solanum pinnatisectum TaxID=50273 RepID=A0AAV9K714_9SOLN|nr:hypothetical protein R3W88_029873 [Solanum pinnatisectum]
MVCELEDSSLDELLIHIYHTTLCFGIKEFFIITGLNYFTDEDDFLFDTSEPNRIIEQYFEAKSTIKKAELISKYKKKVWGEGNVLMFCVQLKYQNIHPSLNEIAFYKLPTKNNAIPENASEKDDDFTSKLPTHKPNNKAKGKVKVIVPLSTQIKKMSMHASSSCKEKTPSVTHVLKTSKKTPFGLVSTP